MEQLISVRTNVFYYKKGNDFLKHHEVILLLDSPNYVRSNEGEVIRERGIVEQRFIIANDNIDKLIAHLESIKDIEEDQPTGLNKVSPLQTEPT